MEYLYWVGCVASLDDRNRKIAKAFSTILQKAGVSFGILGPDEKCCGDPLRRTGNEYQYQELAAGNVELLEGTGGEEDRDLVPALLQHAEERLPAARRHFRGLPSHGIPLHARHGMERYRSPRPSKA